jgi:phage tail protein X
MNNQRTRNYGESADPQVDAAVKRLTKAALAPNSNQDVALDKRSSFDVRAQMPDPKIITVQSGDTLSKIIIREYGKYDRSTLDSVLKANPDIIDISLIEVGRRITLPRPPQTTANN